MKVSAGRQFETYERSGNEIRIHWNIVQNDKEDMDGNVVPQWEADEVVVSVLDSRSAIIEAIIGTTYSTGAELATINNKDTDAEAYAAYQSFRVLAKSLADNINV